MRLFHWSIRGNCGVPTIMHDPGPRPCFRDVSKLVATIYQEQEDYTSKDAATIDLGGGSLP